jgi:uncharacterized protein YceH (UPF0502 family)
MPILQVLERLRQVDSSSSYYHLLGNEPDSLEKGEETETTISDIEHSELSADADATRHRIVAFRWLLRRLKTLLPSFLHPPLAAAQAEPKRLRPTAWLGK